MGKLLLSGIAGISIGAGLSDLLIDMHTAAAWTLIVEGVGALALLQVDAYGTKPRRLGGRARAALQRAAARGTVTGISIVSLNGDSEARQFANDLGRVMRGARWGVSFEDGFNDDQREHYGLVFECPSTYPDAAHLDHLMKQLRGRGFDVARGPSTLTGDVRVRVFALDESFGAAVGRAIRRLPGLNR
jgi:hypothetical protein